MGVNVFGFDGFKDEASVKRAVQSLFQKGVRNFRVVNVGAWADAALVAINEAAGIYGGASVQITSLFFDSASTSVYQRLKLKPVHSTIFLCFAFCNVRSLILCMFRVQCQSKGNIQVQYALNFLGYESAQSAQRFLVLDVGKIVNMKCSWVGSATMCSMITPERIQWVMKTGMFEFTWFYHVPGQKLASPVSISLSLSKGKPLLVTVDFCSSAVLVAFSFVIGACPTTCGRAEASARVFQAGWTSLSAPPCQNWSSWPTCSEFWFNWIHVVTQLYAYSCHRSQSCGLCGPSVRCSDDILLMFGSFGCLGRSIAILRLLCSWHEAFARMLSFIASTQLNKALGRASQKQRFFGILSRNSPFVLEVWCGWGTLYFP